MAVGTVEGGEVGLYLGDEAFEETGSGGLRFFFHVDFPGPLRAPPSLLIFFRHPWAQLLSCLQQKECFNNVNKLFITK